MRKLTLAGGAADRMWAARQMGARIAGTISSLTVIGFLLAGPGNVLPAQTIREPITTLRIVETDRPTAQRTDEKTIIDGRNVSLAIRHPSAMAAKLSDRPAIGQRGNLGNASAPLAASVRQGDVSTRLRLKVSAGFGETPATGETEVRLKLLADSTRIVTRPVTGQISFNTLRSGHWTSAPERVVTDRQTFAFDTTPRTNVLRMDDAGWSQDAVRITSYRGTPAEQPIEQPAEPRRRVFSATPLQKAAEPASSEPLVTEAERLGPFEVTDQLETLNVLQRCRKMLRTRLAVDRTAVADPAVCTVVKFGPGELSLVGMQTGQTRVTFWFAEDQHRPVTYLIRVTPNPVLD